MKENKIFTFLFCKKIWKRQAFSKFIHIKEENDFKISLFWNNYELGSLYTVYSKERKAKL
jgi:hypothetical protein